MSTDGLATPWRWQRWSGYHQPQFACRQGNAGPFRSPAANRPWRSGRSGLGVIHVSGQIVNSGVLWRPSGRAQPRSVEQRQQRDRLSQRASARPSDGRATEQRGYSGPSSSASANSRLEYDDQFSTTTQPPPLLRSTSHSMTDDEKRETVCVDRVGACADCAAIQWRIGQ
jgi:hypothetical protein